MTEALPAAPARPATAVDGVVLLDKPRGLSSNIALQKVKRLFGARKAGHTGSLDPLASGLLPICLGQATRFSGFLLDAAKAYQVGARLGTRTATGDTEGDVVEQCPWEGIDADALRSVLEGFRGRISQVPPMYSALKQGGERLYRKARRGEEVERPPRPVEIHALELVSWDPPAFTLEVSCSKGTYVRTLVEDIARAAGSCAHVTALRRVGAGPFTAEAMHSLAELEALAARGPDELGGVVLSADTALSALPAVSLSEEDVLRLVRGQVVDAAPGSAGGLLRAYGPTGFLGLVERDGAGHVRAKRLLDTSRLS
ncbi:tRNA pseudouridine(55) synthase TruB [Thioalkalivibrio sp. XN279]|uniref:tRNA pseudouridine(55) synthase TruB n=1 Tax=Thioalkalivibrio sp. XN279 TaxID=2714953 RepID=UPI00140D9ECF|nr:tRNA pseudouridine(55) synthase TruB [Thioalkalivibrio sp. XN279]NHA14549.1 tRNA pseudouridine(55) synthase TruB [Thioalkalivibrio sp. XN279]